MSKITLKTERNTESSGSAMQKLNEKNVSDARMILSVIFIVLM